MFAVIKTGGKQYRVAANDVITVATVEGGPGDQVIFDEVLLVGGEGGAQVGTPSVAGASVAGELVRQTRGEKVIAFKKRRRQNSRRKRGHRQDLTVIRITEVLTGGARPTQRAAQAASTQETSTQAASTQETAPALPPASGDDATASFQAGTAAL